MKKPQITKETLCQYLLIALGSLVYAVGQLYFIKPLHIPMGGVSGIALVANYLWNLPIGVLTESFDRIYVPAYDASNIWLNGALPAEFDRTTRLVLTSDYALDGSYVIVS